MAGRSKGSRSRALPSACVFTAGREGPSFRALDRDRATTIDISQEQHPAVERARGSGRQKPRAGDHPEPELVVSHGWRWLDYCKASEDEEPEHVKLAVRGVEALAGAPPVGWFSGRPSAIG